MGKQEFTKEQIEFIRNDFRESPLSWDDYLDSLLKPETKFIDVRIEYVPFKNAFDSIQNIYVSDVSRELRSNLNDKFNIKVTELPEVFTREDMIEFANIDHIRYCDIEPNLEKFISERNQNE